MTHQVYGQDETAFRHLPKILTRLDWVECAYILSLLYHEQDEAGPSTTPPSRLA